MNFTPSLGSLGSSFKKEVGKPHLHHRVLQRKSLLMQVLFFVFCMHTGVLNGQANEITQSITIVESNASLESIFKQIEKQSDYRFFYKESIIQRAGKVNINVKNVNLTEALNACFRNQPLTYDIVDKTIIVKQREDIKTETPTPRFAKLPFVKGTVTSDSGPVAGASVTEKGTKNGTSTNAAGEFMLNNVEENATLVISSVSHESQEFLLGGKTDVTVALKKRVNELDEQVVVAYSTTTQRRATGSFTVVKGEEVQTLPNRSIDKSLQGLVPGLFVTSGTGQPGGGVANFVLRGIATGDNGERGSTLRNPLIVVDGVPVSQDAQQLNIGISDVPYNNPMAQINPSDIESITVLKDAAAIALYGSKAANGVILLTTKKGKAGKPQFNVRSQVDLAQRLEGKIKLLNQQQYLELVYESYRNSIPGISDADILTELKKTFPTRSDGSFYPAVNWPDLVYTKNASTLTNEFSVSGGSDRSNFYFNVEWTKQNGVYRKSGFDRKSMRFNFENKPFPWITYGMNTGLSYAVQDYADLVNDPNAIVNLSSPLQPIRDENGNYFLYFPYLFNATNPIAAMEYNSNRGITYRGLTKLYAAFDFLRHFKFTSSFGVDFGVTEAKEKYDPRLYDALNGSTGSGRIEDGTLRSASLISTNTLAYDNRFNNNHSLSVLLGQEAQINSQRNVIGIGTNLALPYYNQIDNAPNRSSYGNATKQTLVSYFGQAIYGYKNKYFLSLSGRLDGSSKFGEDQQYGSFWSTGAGWNIIEEGFMKGARTWIDHLKIRGSLGVAGNSGAIDRYTKYNRLQTTSFLFSAPAIYPNSFPANPNIQWEQTFTWDAGIEARAWNNRISLNADIYRRKTSNLIYTIVMPPVSGFANMLANIGDMENKGVEITLSVDILKTRNFKWNLNGNWSINRNKLIKANVNIAALSSGYLANEEGRNFNSFFMRRWAGVDPNTGSTLYIDSTGKPNSNYNAAKPEFVGKPQPDGFGAITNTFSYKQLSLSFLLYYQYGFQVYDSPLLLFDGSNVFGNQDVRALNRWQKPGDNAVNPKRTIGSAYGYEISTRRLNDGDYIRLQNVSLSYIMPNKLVKAIHLNNIKVFLQAYNVAVWTKYKGADVANINTGGNAMFNYPNARTYSAGINIGL